MREIAPFRLLWLWHKENVCAVTTVTGSARDLFRAMGMSTELLPYVVYLNVYDAFLERCSISMGAQRKLTPPLARLHPRINKSFSPR